MQGHKAVFGPTGRAFAVWHVARFNPLEPTGTFIEAR
jgi:hypothetical protein